MVYSLHRYTLCPKVANYTFLTFLTCHFIFPQHKSGFARTYMPLFPLVTNLIASTVIFFITWMNLYFINTVGQPSSSSISAFETWTIFTERFPSRFASIALYIVLNSKILISKGFSIFVTIFNSVFTEVLQATRNCSLTFISEAADIGVS